MVQASGKHRPIDDVARFSHKNLTGFAEAIETCTALQPGFHLRAFAVEAKKMGISWEKVRFETGGTPLPFPHCKIPVLKS